jgi:Domain of unknown function (DUF4145)
MAPKIVPPSVKLKSFSCPHCGAHADQTWWSLLMSGIGDDGLPLSPSDFLVRVQQKLPSSQEEEEQRAQFIEHVNRLLNREVFKSETGYTSSAVELANVHVSECYSCGRLTIWHYDTILYPARRYEIEANPDLPDDIRDDFDEARAILDLSPRGAAALLRLCIQKLCIHLGKSGKSIDDDIASLVKDGLNVRVQQALDVVRVVGNEAVHPGQLALKEDRDTAATLFDLVNRIAYDTITHPKEVAVMYEKLPASKRDAIAKRDAAKKSDE